MAPIKFQACFIPATSVSTDQGELYGYTTDLLCLDFRRPRHIQWAPDLAVVATPLIREAWAMAISTHPDQAVARYICNGLQFGFRIGFAYGAPLRSASTNMESARQYPAIISDYLRKELSLGRMLRQWLPLGWIRTLCISPNWGGPHTVPPPKQQGEVPEGSRAWGMHCTMSLIRSSDKRSSDHAVASLAPAKLRLVI